MRQSSLLRFFGIGLVIAAALGMVSFYALRAETESSTSELRRHMITIIAQTVESGPYSETVQDRRFRGARRAAGTYLWVFSDQGQVIASNVETPPPVSWNELKKPEYVHDFTFHYRPFHLLPDLTLVKLDAPENVYLLIGTRRLGSLSGMLWVEIAFLFFLTCVTALVAIGLIYFYLRKKSDEARSVLSRLEKGDLQARFQIKRIDEIGSLMLDFNRMAAEIERLVHRVQETERARKNLLEELSHDIRTPLTSLKTSIETLSEHLDEMPKEEQKEFLSVSRSELGYFIRLIDDLFFIADLGEPLYKKTTRRIDLRALISDELNLRAKNERALQWKSSFEIDPKDAVLMGDPLLIERLLKNALDNAAKYARSFVQVGIQSKGASISILIDNDGPGITDESIALFGQRKKQRISTHEKGGGASLGLGSVIMKTIVELHGGELKIERLPQGTRLRLALPTENHLEPL